MSSKENLIESVESENKDDESKRTEQTKAEVNEEKEDKSEKDPSTSKTDEKFDKTEDTKSSDNKEDRSKNDEYKGSDVSDDEDHKNEPIAQKPRDKDKTEEAKQQELDNVSLDQLTYDFKKPEYSDDSNDSELKTNISRPDTLELHDMNSPSKGRECKTVCFSDLDNQTFETIIKPTKSFFIIETALVIFCVVFTLINTYIDLILMVYYYQKQWYNYACFTTIFVLTPKIINTMYLYDRCDLQPNLKFYKLIRNKFVLFVIFIFQIPEVVMYIDNYRHKMKYISYQNDLEQDRMELKKLILEGNEYLLKQRKFECFLGAAPQLITQIVFIMSCRYVSTFLDINLKISVITSFMLIVWNITPNNKVILTGENEKFKSILEVMVFVGHMLTVFSRLFAICMLLSCHPKHTAFILFLHWVAMMVLYNTMGKYVVEKNTPNQIYYLKLSVLSIVATFVITMPLKVIKRVCVIYYCICLFENVVAALLWKNMMLPNLMKILSIGPYSLGVLMMFMYYSLRILLSTGKASRSTTNYNVTPAV